MKEISKGYAYFWIRHAEGKRPPHFTWLRIWNRCRTSWRNKLRPRSWLWHRLQPKRICEVDRVIPNISIKVGSATKPNWVFIQESSRIGIIVSGAIVVQTYFGIKLASGVAEGICGVSAGCRHVAKGVVRIGVRRVAR